MKVFLAGDAYRPWEKFNFSSFYRLDSYLTLSKQANFMSPHAFDDFILDSGVFSYLNGKDGSKVDWDKYVVDYAAFVKKHKIKNYVEVDIDRMVGLEVVEKLRAKLESLVGWQSMPVWHMNRSYDKWLEICRSHSYICFGAFLTDNLPESKYPYVRQFIADAKKENCRVHGLGFTSMKWLRVLPFYSVDSSSWTAGSRFGHVVHFDGKNINPINRPANTKVRDQKQLAYHNFFEWVKFVRYADKNL